MADALQFPAPNPLYLDYFGMEQLPFARLPTPEALCHVEQYTLLMDRLSTAKSATDQLLVLRGVDGSGKTTLLNRFLSTLEDGESYACIDDNCKSALDFYRAFLEQIGFKNIEGKLEELRSITREFLIHRSVVDDAVLLVIDNAQRIHPAVFEQLRWLSGIKRSDRRILSIVLAGNSNLGHILRSPAMASLNFDVCVDFHIRAYSDRETADYIQHRLMLAGAIDTVAFTPEALALVHRFSGGIPRWINRIGNLLLAQACTQKTHVIDDALVRNVAEAEQLPANVYPLKNRGRRRTDVTDTVLPEDDLEEEQLQQRQALTKNPDRQRLAAPPVPDVDISRLFDQIAELSAQIGKLKAEKARADQDVETRNLDIRKLQELLARKEASLQQGAQDLQALQESLDQQEQSANTAQSEVKRSLARIEKLERIKAKLEESSKKLRSDLQSATEKAEKLADLERQLDKTAKENESLRAGLQELEELRDNITARDESIAALKEELAHLVASNTTTQPRLAEMSANTSAGSDDATAGADGLENQVVALEIMRRGQVEQVFDLRNGTGRIMIGRETDSELRLESTFVSRHHALIFWRPLETLIEDLNSYNGTIVNGRTITRCELRPNDTIIIGEYLLRPLGAN